MGLLLSLRSIASDKVFGEEVRARTANKCRVVIANAVWRSTGKEITAPCILHGAQWQEPWARTASKSWASFIVNLRKKVAASEAVWAWVPERVAENSFVHKASWSEGETSPFYKKAIDKLLLKKGKKPSKRTLKVRIRIMAFCFADTDKIISFAGLSIQALFKTCM